MKNILLPNTVYQNAAVGFTLSFVFNKFPSLLFLTRIYGFLLAA
jgi:hypothetical protein